MIKVILLILYCIIGFGVGYCIGQFNTKRCIHERTDIKEKNEKNK